MLLKFYIFYMTIFLCEAEKFGFDINEDQTLKSAIMKYKTSECGGSSSSEEEESHESTKKKRRKSSEESTEESDESESEESKEKKKKRRRHRGRNNRRRNNNNRNRNNNDYDDDYGDDSNGYNNRNFRYGMGRNPYQNRDNPDNRPQRPRRPQKYYPYQNNRNNQGPYPNQDPYSGGQDQFSYGYGYPVARPGSIPGPPISFPGKPETNPDGQDQFGNNQNPFAQSDYDSPSKDFDPFTYGGIMFQISDQGPYSNRGDPFSNRRDEFQNEWEGNFGNGRLEKRNNRHRSSERSSHKRKNNNRKKDNKEVSSDEEVCISKCIFDGMEIMDDDEVPSESAFIKWAEDNLKNEKIKTGAVKQIRKCFGTIASASSEDSCEVSRSLSSCLKLELEDDD